MNILKLAILHVGYWDTGRGGIQYQLKLLSEELMKTRDVETHYLAGNIKGVRSRENLVFHDIGMPGVIRRRALFLDFLKIINALNKIDPDVIYTNGLNSYVGFASLYARKHGIPHIFHIASDYDVSPPGDQTVSLHVGMKFVEQWLGEYGIKNASMIIAQTRSQCEKVNGFVDKKIKIIPNFQPIPSDIEEIKEEPTILWIGNFKPVKRPEIFLDLRKKLKKDGVKFKMIGYSGKGGTYSDLIEEIMGTENIEYLGEKSIEEVNKYLEKASMLVCTSIVEGFPNTFIQAWMRGVPIVSTVDVDGLMKDEGLGVYIENEGDLPSVVEGLLNDHAKAKAIGEKAKCYARRKYSMGNALSLIDTFRAASISDYK